MIFRKFILIASAFVVGHSYAEEHSLLQGSFQQLDFAQNNEPVRENNAEYNVNATGCGLYGDLCGREYNDCCRPYLCKLIGSFAVCLK